MRRTRGAAALEHVKIPRLARSLHAAAVLTVAAASAARAQDARPDSMARADSSTHTVKRGDTLWDLANAYLGDAYLWPEIYRLNTDQIEDPHWIYPGEILRLPGRTAAAPSTIAATPGAQTPGPVNPYRAPAVEEPPRRVAGPTVFRVYTRSANTTREVLEPTAPPRVPLGDVVRAPYFDRQGGPRASGKLLVGIDIPGIAAPPQSMNFQLYDKILMRPASNVAAAERDRYMAYDLVDNVEGIGSVVVPTAMLRVVRAPQNGEGAIVEVLELYDRLDGDTRVVLFDTAGAGANAIPVPVTRESAKTAKIRSIYRPAVLPSLNYYVLFDLKAEDGVRIGDEIEVYRKRQNQQGDDGPAVPELPVATGQVVKVTDYGATARIVTQEQTLIQVGQGVRITARMP
jgi:LysM repeat protein